MTHEFPPAVSGQRSRKAVIGFWLWAAAIVLFVVALVLGIALDDTLPGDMGIGSSVTFPIVGALIAIPISTVGLGFAITSLAKRETKKGLAVTTIVLWAVTPIVALMVARFASALIG